MLCEILGMQELEWEIEEFVCWHECTSEYVLFPHYSFRVQEYTDVNPLQLLCVLLLICN